MKLNIPIAKINTYYLTKIFGTLRLELWLSEVEEVFSFLPYDATLSYDYYAPGIEPGIKNYYGRFAPLTANGRLINFELLSGYEIDDVHLMVDQLVLK